MQVFKNAPRLGFMLQRRSAVLLSRSAKYVDNSLNVVCRSFSSNSLSGTNPEASSNSRLSLKDSLLYCREAVRTRSPDMFEHIHLLPKREQTHALALRALALELNAIPFSATNPTLAMMRLQWWRSAVERIQALVEEYHGMHTDQNTEGKTKTKTSLPHPPNHYVVQVLAHLARDDFQAFDFDLVNSMLSVHEQYIDRKEIDTLAELVSLVDRDHGAMMALLVSLSLNGETNRDTTQTYRIPEDIHKAAVLTARGMGLTHVLKVIPYWLKQRHVLLPRDLLLDNSLDIETVKKYAVQLDSGIMSATHIDVNSPSTRSAQDNQEPKMGVPEDVWPKMSDEAKSARIQGESLRSMASGEMGSTTAKLDSSHVHTTSCNHHSDDSTPDTREAAIDSNARAAAANLREVFKVIAAVAEEQLHMGLSAAHIARSDNKLSKAGASEIILPAIVTKQFLDKLREVNFDVFHPTLTSLNTKEMFWLRAKTLWKNLTL